MTRTVFRPQEKGRLRLDGVGRRLKLTGTDQNLCSLMIGEVILDTDLGVGEQESPHCRILADFLTFKLKFHSILLSLSRIHMMAYKEPRQSQFIFNNLVEMVTAKPYLTSTCATWLFQICVEAG